ncbi:MAG TPA: multidrug ABC transporter ATP-binding protein, partial [Ruminococcaceae bacterium]|nr:multidrug ABC transporter ATP-binding protein [Oscillospiraceae bacterium]
MPGQKAKDFKGTMKKLISYLGKYRLAVIIVWLFAIISTVFTILGPKILGFATDELFGGITGIASGTGGGIDFAKIGRILLLLAALYIASALFMYIQSYIMTNVTMKLTYQLRKELNDKIHRLPFGYYDKITHGEVLSRITNDVDT